MCDFFSYIRKADGSILYLTDDMIEARWPHSDFTDHIGHSAIAEYFKVDESIGKHIEGIGKVPPEVATLINKGKLNKMLQAGGYKYLRYDKRGDLLEIDGRKKADVLRNRTAYKPSRPNSFEGLKIGDKVILGRHAPRSQRRWYDSDAFELGNWDPEMNAFVGTEATIRSFDKTSDGDNKYGVLVNENGWFWRVENLTLVEPKP